MSAVGYKRLAAQLCALEPACLEGWLAWQGNVGYRHPPGWPRRSRGGCCGPHVRCVRYAGFIRLHRSTFRRRPRPVARCHPSIPQTSLSRECTRETLWAAGAERAPGLAVVRNTVAGVHLTGWTINSKWGAYTCVDYSQCMKYRAQKTCNW